MRFFFQILSIFFLGVFCAFAQETDENVTEFEKNLFTKKDITSFLSLTGLAEFVFDTDPKINANIIRLANDDAPSPLGQRAGAVYLRSPVQFNLKYENMIHTNKAAQPDNYLQHIEKLYNDLQKQYSETDDPLKKDLLKSQIEPLEKVIREKSVGQAITQKYDFSTFFQLRFHGTTTDAGTGAVFVLHTDPRGTEALGYCKNCMGYYGTLRPHHLKIYPSIGVEFDISFDPPMDFDLNMVGINLNGDLTSLGLKNGEYVFPYFNNGKIWNCWVDYDGTFMEIRLSQYPDRPIGPLIKQTVRLEKVFNLRTKENEAPKVYAGFTADAGLIPANHDLVSWKFRGYYEPYGNVFSVQGE